MLSASDDQTVRIFNWQSRSQIAVITGHSHYAMCARFHPRTTLLLTCSLDSTFRVWDYDKLQQKQGRGRNLILFNDVELMVAQRAHEKGVNWADFGAGGLIATCSDDGLVKVWRYQDREAVELRTIYGSGSNINCVQFLKESWVVSVSDGGELQVWDEQGRVAGQYPRQGGARSDKQWAVAVQRETSVIAVGSDRGLRVFKYNQRQTAYGFYNNDLVYYDQQEKALAIVKGVGDCNSNSNNIENNSSWQVERYKFGADVQNLQCFEIAINRFQQNFLQGVAGFSSQDGEPTHFIFTLKSGELETFQQRGPAFINENKFLCSTGSGQLRILKFPGFSVYKQLPHLSYHRIFPGELNKVFFVANDTISYFQCLSQNRLFRIRNSKFREIKNVEVRGENVFVICDKQIFWYDLSGVFLGQTQEQLPILSHVFLRDGVLLYNTHAHVKYLLVGGETGIVKNANQRFWMLGAGKRVLRVLKANGEVAAVEIEFATPRVKN